MGWGGSRTRSLRAEHERKGGRTQGWDEGGVRGLSAEAEALLSAQVCRVQLRVWVQG